MYCSKCGTKIEKDSRFCYNCGENIGDVEKIKYVYCEKCGSEFINGTSCPECNNVEKDADKELEDGMKKIRERIKDQDSYQNFMKRNWWFLLLGFAKVISFADNSANNSMTQSYLGDFLAGVSIVFIIMTVYWFIRYKLLNL